VEDHLHLVGLARHCSWLRRPTRLAQDCSSIPVNNRQVVIAASAFALKVEPCEGDLDLLASGHADLVSLILFVGVVVWMVVRLNRTALSFQLANATSPDTVTITPVFAFALRASCTVCSLMIATTDGAFVGVAQS